MRQTKIRADRFLTVAHYSGQKTHFCDLNIPKVTKHFMNNGYIKKWLNKVEPNLVCDTYLNPICGANGIYHIGIESIFI